MKIVKRITSKRSRRTSVTFLPTTEDDIWYLYNIIIAGDVVRTSTCRKVKTQRGEFGVVQTARTWITLTVLVLEVSFQCDDAGTSLLLKTRNAAPNDFVAVGQMQTVEVIPGIEITVVKDEWNARTLSFFERAREEPSKEALIALVEDGICAFYSMRENFTALRLRVGQSLPRRKGGMREIYEKRLAEFDRKVWTALKGLIAEAPPRVIVFAGPGTAKKRITDKLRAIDQHETVAEVRTLLKSVFKSILVVNASSVLRPALEEILQNPSFAAQMADARSFKEAKKMEEFFTALSRNPDTAVYGLREVAYACEQSAIRDLLVTDTVLRTHDFAKRNEIARLVQRAEAQGAAVFELNGHHASGQRLRDLTGIAATLKYPLKMEEGFQEEAATEEPQISNESIKELLLDTELFGDHL